ncbi:MAG: hypothetical protein ABSD75_01200 [Terriglobales bacterium]
MAGTLAILGALRRLVRRDLTTIFSISWNNFFLFIVPIAAGGLVAIAPFVFLFGIVLLVPLCADPLHKVPPSRLNSWPLGPRERWALHAGSLALSPPFCIATLLLVLGAGTMSALIFLVVAVAVQGLSALANHAALRLPMLNPVRSVPQLPGKLGGVIRLAARQIFSVLDFYAAAILSLAATTYRIVAARPDPETFSVCALLVALGLSTFAQQMFGMDSDAGMARYRLMPLSGWQLLLGKDIAYFSVLTVLTAPLDLGAGLTFALSAVAVGRYSSLRLRSTQLRWRFVKGDIRFGVCQLIAGFVLGIGYERFGWRFFAGAAAAYGGSLAVGAAMWDRHQRL